MWDNADIDTSMSSLSQNQLGREAGADIATDWKGDTRNGFEDRTLARGLVAADNDLREGDVVADAMRTKGVDRVQELQFLLRAKTTEAVGGELGHDHADVGDGEKV